MDPNPKSFPILSYVMSRLHPNPNPPQTGTPDVDIEQPPPSDPQGGGDQLQLVEQMPHLNQPELLASMAHAVSDVAQTRSVLQALGERPDHEHVDAARTRIAEIEADLSRKLEEIVRTPRPDEVDRLRWREQLEEREECRERGEREKYAYREVVRLEEMHEAYNKLLSDAENRLAKIYGSAGEENEDPVIEAGEEVNEEVIGILREGAAGRCLERVELSGRQLRFIPEDFGKLRGLLVLNLSNNQLEAIPDSIAGLEHLEELRLSSNLLVSLPHSIGLLLNLKILDVSRNKLKSLPDSISHCRSLVELDASFNQLTYLPTNIGYELVNLQRLLVHLNKIRSLPTSISEMSSLRHLDAHFNELRGLPHSIGKLTDLETLDLSSNFSDMTELPETFGDLTDLRELDLSNNQIHALPNTFGRLDNLVKLNLDQNPLVIPPVEIVSRGVEAVKEYMAKRWLNILLEEEKKSVVEANSNQSPRYGWLTRSTSLLNSWASGVSGSVAGYLGTGEKQQPYKDPCLDQQF